METWYVAGTGIVVVFPTDDGGLVAINYDYKGGVVWSKVVV